LPDLRITHSITETRDAKPAALSKILRGLRFSLLATAAWVGFDKAAAAEAAPSPTPATAAIGPYYIREYRVQGAHKLDSLAVGEAVYPYLGPGRSDEDIEHARAALEQAYHDKGYQTVIVQVPQQSAKSGVIVMQVVETKIGRLRVRGSRFYLPSRIRAAVPSLAEGTVPNFNDVTRDILAVNQWPGRTVKPSMKQGAEPGTVDIDLDVEDKMPLHGSIDFNNRYSAFTSDLRLNASLSYDNLWQLGHSAGFSMQISPESEREGKTYSAYYIARFANPDWPALLLQGTKQDSDVATLGGLDSVGRNDTLGMRFLFNNLPGADGFFQSFSFGADYKRAIFYAFQIALESGKLVFKRINDTSAVYFPLTASYSATWVKPGALTEFNTDLIFHIRGLGSGDRDFSDVRYKAAGNFIYIRGDLSHTHDLPAGFQLYGKVQGQLADQPLIANEQFSAGGLTTVRGYLEAAALGDSGIAGTLEIRSPSLIPVDAKKQNEWRIYAFADAGYVAINDALPEQQSHAELASYGFGTRISLFNHFNGSLDAGIPLTSIVPTSAHDLLLTFRIEAEF